MTKRSPVVVLALTLVTFGFYAYYWLYTTSDEVRRESGKRDISPILDALLAFMTVGAWGVWAGYRNAKIAHELIDARGIAHTDHSLPVAIAGGASYFMGPWTWLVAMVLLQEDLNLLAEPYDYFASDRAVNAPRARVDVEPAPVAEPVPARAQSDVAVFESNAPAPIVF